MSWKEILAAAERVEDRNDVAYYEVCSRRVLNSVRAPGLPFDLSLNPYLGCEIGCTYCFAREFSQKRQAGQGSFEREVYVKTEAPERLRAELARRARTGKLAQRIALGTATDPYQPVERRRGLTRRLLEVLAEYGATVLLSTQSDLILRDLDVLQTLSERGALQVSLTITTPDRDLARTLEPRAPTPRRRLDAVEGLARAGIPVGVTCAPVLPDITDDSRDLRRLAWAAKAAGAQWFSAGMLELREGTRPSFFAWLAEHRPSLIPRYRRRYAVSHQAPEAIREPVDRLLRSLRQQYGLAEAPPRLEPSAAVAVGAQLELFGGAEPRRLPLSEPTAA